MNDQPNDNPKITAFALGELDPSESGAIENELRASGTYDEVLDEYRELEGLLTDSFAMEEAVSPDLGEDRRSLIERQMATVRGLRQRRHEPKPVWQRIGVWLPFLLIIIILVIVAWIGSSIVSQLAEADPDPIPEPEATETAPSSDRSTAPPPSDPFADRPLLMD